MVCDFLNSRGQRNEWEYSREKTPDIEAIGFHHKNTTEIVEKRIAANHDSANE